MALIELKNIQKKFGSHGVLRGISFKVEKGQLIGVKGESGAGKSTLLKLLVGYLNFDEGEVAYKLKKEKYDLVKIKNHHDFANQIGFSCQEGSFYDDLSVYENLDFYGTMHGLRKQEINEKIKKILPLVNLSGKAEVLARHLSVGMQKRLDIACALVHEPQIIFLDEPTAHLDENNQQEIWQLIKKINEKGMTMLVTSHFPKDLKRFCDKVYELKEGKLK